MLLLLCGLFLTVLGKYTTLSSLQSITGTRPVTVQSYSGGISNTDSKKILLHKITASLFGAGRGVLQNTHTRIHIPIRTCKWINLLCKPGFELFLGWVTFFPAATEPELLLHAREDAPLYTVIAEGCDMCLVKEATINVNCCVCVWATWLGKGHVCQREASSACVTWCLSRPWFTGCWMMEEKTTGPMPCDSSLQCPQEQEQPQPAAPARGAAVVCCLGRSVGQSWLCRKAACAQSQAWLWAQLVPTACLGHFCLSSAVSGSFCPLPRPICDGRAAP